MITAEQLEELERVVLAGRIPATTVLQVIADLRLCMIALGEDTLRVWGASRPVWVDLLYGQLDNANRRAKAAETRVATLVEACQKMAESGVTAEARVRELEGLRDGLMRDAVDSPAIRGLRAELVRVLAERDRYRKALEYVDWVDRDNRRDKRKIMIEMFDKVRAALRVDADNPSQALIPKSD